MWLKKLDVSNFRNIEHVTLDLIPRFNFIVGRNGSGKSSLLEALHCLSTGQSFRTNKTLPIIRSGNYETIIFGEVVSANRNHRVGIKKRANDATLLRLDNSSSATQSDLAQLTPILGVTPEAEDLLEGGNKQRLSYLDWTLFHVEPTFMHAWREYRRALKQRNAAIRTNMPDTVISSWDEALVLNGEHINSHRLKLIERLFPVISRHITNLIPELDLTLSYRKGWSKGFTLSEALAVALEGDKKMGFTHPGIHRADLLIRVADKPVTEVASRGQRKMVVIALRLAQSEDYQQVVGQKPILFIDDLAAELDVKSRLRVLSAIDALQIQTVISGTDAEELPLEHLAEYLLFHVEQGAVTNVV